MHLTPAPRVRFDDWFPAVRRLPHSAAVRTAAVMTALVVLATVALILWRTWPSAANLIWAEDGAVFVEQGIQFPFATAILEPYNGYAHVVPRLLTEVTLLLPVADWALGLAALSALLRASLGAMVWYALAAHVPSRFVRALVAVVLVTVPLGNYEALDNIANVHWFLMAATLPALLWTPATWRGRTVQWFVVAASILSDPVTCLLAPIVLLRFAARRGWRDHIVSVVFVAASALQASVVLGTERTSWPGRGAGEIVRTYLVRVVLALFGGKGGTEWAFARFGWLAVNAALIAAVVILVLGLRRRGPHRIVAVLSVAASMVFFAVSMRFGIQSELLLPRPDMSLLNGSRYSITSEFLLATALIVCAAAALRATSARAVRVTLATIAGVVILVYAIGVVLTIGQPSVAPNGEPWRTAVETGCANSAQPNETIHIAPPQLAIVVPCALITSK